VILARSEPTADPAIITAFLVAQARDTVTVLIQPSLGTDAQLSRVLKTAGSAAIPTTRRANRRRYLGKVPINVEFR
jgi:hypothetical protein